MPLEPELVALMLDRITLELQTGVDKYNNFVYGPPIEDVQCQIVKMNKRALTIDGREIISHVQVILADATIAVTPNARMTLPDGTKPPIIELLAADDDTGPYYLELRA